MKFWLLGFVFAFFGYSGSWCYARSTDFYNQDIRRLQDLGTINNKRLVVTFTSLTWFEADRLCRMAKGSLMRIGSKTEDDFLIDALKKLNPHRIAYGGYWLGARSDPGNKTSFYWVNSGEDLESGYTNWGRGQPNSQSGNEMECLDMSVHSDFTWNDFDCNKWHTAICEIPLPSSSTTFCPTLPPTSPLPVPTQPRISIGSVTEDPLFPKFLKDEINREDQTCTDLERVVALLTALLVISLLILFVLVGTVFLRYGPNSKRYSQMNNDSKF